jgi:diaminopimelate epimerase
VSDQIRFAKYHGTGNDFVLVEDLDGEHPLSEELNSALCDRRFGVGADGTIRITGATTPGALFFMDYRNADGSLAEMCGNGIRCLGKAVFDRGFTDRTAFDVDTRAGVKHLSLDVRDGRVSSVTVGMGAPAFDRAHIPMTGPAGDRFLGEPLRTTSCSRRRRTWNSFSFRGRS